MSDELPITRVSRVVATVDIKGVMAGNAAFEDVFDGVEATDIW